MICDWLQCCTCSQSYQQLLIQIWIQRHGILDKDEYRKCWEEMLGGKGGLSVSSRTWGTFPDTQSRLSMLAPSRGARGWWRTWTSELMCKEGETNVKRAGGLQAIERSTQTWKMDMETVLITLSQAWQARGWSLQGTQLPTMLPAAHWSCPSQ